MGSDVEDPDPGGGGPKLSGLFFKAGVQAVLLLGEDT